MIGKRDESPNVADMETAFTTFRDEVIAKRKTQMEADLVDVEDPKVYKVDADKVPIITSEWIANQIPRGSVCKQGSCCGIAVNSDGNNEYNVCLPSNISTVPVDSTAADALTYYF